MKIAAALCLLLAASPAAAGERFRGTVVHVADGDTFTLSGGTVVRLWGIDAPERHQSCSAADGRPYFCGERARQALEAVVLNRPAACEDLQPRGSYGRKVAACAVDGVDLGQFMVSHGYAVDYRRYSHGAYAADQETARRHSAGIWSGRFELPEEWRRAHDVSSSPWRKK